jgi:hypothetical protein
MINRIEVEAAIVEVLAAVLDGRSHAVLTLDGVDRLAVSTPAAAFDTGFAIAIEPIAKSLDADLAAVSQVRASIEPVSAG